MLDYDIAFNLRKTYYDIGFKYPELQHYKDLLRLFDEYFELREEGLDVERMYSKNVELQNKANELEHKLKNMEKAYSEFLLDVKQAHNHCQEWDFGRITKCSECKYGKICSARRDNPTNA